MMFLLARKRGCNRTRNPRLAALLGLASALIIGGATFLERHDGAHWPISIAVIVGGALIGFGVVRLVMLIRDGGQ
jgi:hypothetical protein